MESMFCKTKTGFRKGTGFLSIYMVFCISCFFFGDEFSVYAAQRVQEVSSPIVVVIDPGHGGENSGTLENNHEEKSMTLSTALAMYEELSLYDGIEVYLTRTDDTELSLKERAQFASDLNADFLFSIHYNASANHELFGAEVWVSHFAPMNAYGYQFGDALLQDLSEQGLFIRGVKTRLDKNNQYDYYGIIRESTALGIPSCIIEHCHVDEERDEGFCDTKEKLIAFGKSDATAVAKYFGLKSSVLGVDYTSYSLAEASAPGIASLTQLDTTEPDICQIEESAIDYANYLLSLTVSAADYDTALLYYSYSLDGGATFSRREIWPGSDALSGTYDDTFILQLEIEENTCPRVIVRAYNQYDLYTESNLYVCPKVFPAREIEEESTPNSTAEEESFTEIDIISDEVASAGDDTEKSVSVLTFLMICLIVVVILFLLLFISQAVAHRKRRRRRKGN